MVISGFFFLAILLSLTMVDYGSRDLGESARHTAIAIKNKSPDSLRPDRRDGINTDGADGRSEASEQGHEHDQCHRPGECLGI